MEASGGGDDRLLKRQEGVVRLLKARRYGKACRLLLDSRRGRSARSFNPGGEVISSENDLYLGRDFGEISGMQFPTCLRPNSYRR